jgi:hypothetical protein
LLDGKQITDTNRAFLKRLEINKAGNKLAPNQRHTNSTLPADIMSEFGVYFICETLLLASSNLYFISALCFQV